MAVGDLSSAGSSTEQKSEYFSARVEAMMRSKSRFSSDVEHKIEHSKVHWSEVTGLSELSEDDDHEEEEEEVARENREVFAELMKDPQWRHREAGRFFVEWGVDYKLGRKIAKGGQAAIFEILDDDGSVNSGILFKVFKRGSRLSDLKKQWPRGILRMEVLTCVTYKGVMLEDGRFAFLLARGWGDLRTLIDRAMQEKNNQVPPFPYEWKGETLLAKYFIWRIAFDMDGLHKAGILHRDLKAANILILDHSLIPKTTKIFPIAKIFAVVADYECSIGVVGTGFWRAPEILLALKNGSVIDFNEKADVYSYGMTCFEVVTGRLPFEGELEACRASYDLVIEGRRPQLPSDLDESLKDLIERCWNPFPNERPSFSEILELS